MAKGLQFYKNVVALSNTTHRKLRIKPGTGYRFAAGTNSVFVAAVEFQPASREYPIVFVEADEIIAPMAVLGLKEGQDLFVNEDGSWDARYIPAYVRRYPFVLAGPDATAEKLTVCIDAGFESLNEEEGERLFDDEGKNTKITDEALDFLRNYQRHVQFTQEFCKDLKKLDLLEPMGATINPPGCEQLKVVGFNVVSRERLKALKGAQLAKLIKNDALELIFLHLASLDNFQLLAERHAKRYKSEEDVA
jgi:hypothetical protein